MVDKVLLKILAYYFLLVFSTSALSVEADSVAVVDGFKKAMQNADSEIAASYLAENLTVYEHGYVEASRDEYLNGHFKSDAAFMHSTSTKVLNRTAGVAGETAWVFSETSTRGQYKGREVDSRGTETVLLQKTATGWQIFHIHWSSHKVKPGE